MGWVVLANLKTSYFFFVWQKEELRELISQEFRNRAKEKKKLACHAAAGKF